LTIIGWRVTTWAYQPVLPLDDDPLSFFQGGPVGLAEDHPAVLVLIDPDAYVVASGIE
jgi:hypothetical protein